MRHQIGDVTLIHGDCLDVMPTLAGERFDIVLTDLPYGMTGCAWDTPIPLDQMWRVLKSICAKKCVFIFTAAQPFTSVLLMSNLVDFKQELVWHKKRPTGFYQAKTGPLRAHESICIFGVGNLYYCPQMTPGKKFCVTSKAAAANHYGGKTLDRRLSKHNGQMRHPRSVLDFDEGDLRRDSLNGNKSRILHPTQKPVAMLEWLLRSYSFGSAKILDLCAGSGSTAIAAMRVGDRKVVCIEKDKTYFDAMAARVAAEHAKTPLVQAPPACLV